MTNSTSPNNQLRTLNCHTCVNVDPQFLHKVGDSMESKICKVVNSRELKIYKTICDILFAIDDSIKCHVIALAIGQNCGSDILQ